MLDEWILKICSIGSYNVGKTSLILRYVENKFGQSYLPTLGVEVTTKRLNVDGNQVKLILMDTAGQEKFGLLRKTYYEGSSSALIVYDVTRRETFEAVNDWIHEFNSVVGEDKPLVIIGNKIDLEQLKARGISCGKLKAMIKNKQKDAEMFRKSGFGGLAKKEEESASAIRGLKRRVCLLK